MNALEQLVTNEQIVQQGYPITMFTMTLNEVRDALGAKLVGDDSSDNECIVRGINTDSRTIKQGELFVALKGDKFDAHDYITHAHDRGAAAYLLDHEIENVKPALIVDDTRIAFGQLASAWRNQFNYPVAAVTGSNGKTTVKEMLHSILATQGSVLATKGNFNNDIGVPITLYRMTSQYEHAVIEMGANHKNEISYLTNLVKPDVAIITNAAAAHLEGFGSLDGVSKAKGEIFQGLSDNGVAILNYDDTYFSYWASLVKNKKSISFGENNNANVSFSINNKNNNLIIHFNNNEIFELKLPLLGKHNIVNALAAIAASIALKINFEDIKHGLESMQPIAGRLERKEGVNNSIVIDDTYNANPASLSAAIDAIQIFTGQYHVVLGDMGELGSDAVQLHKDAAVKLKHGNVTFLYTLGVSSEYTHKEFSDKSKHFSTHENLVKELVKNIKEGDIILVKGSRSMQMEKIVNSICLNQPGSGEY